MKILFIWNPFFNITKSKPREFFVNIGVGPIWDKLVFNENNKKVFDIIKSRLTGIYSISYRYDFINDKSIYDGIKDAIKQYINLIEEAEFDEQDHFVIGFSLSGQRYVQRVLMQICKEINEFKFGESSNHIDYIETDINSIVSKKGNSYSFDFSKTLPSASWACTKDIFVFESYIESIQKMNLNFINSCNELSTKTPIKKVSVYFGRQYIHDWLLSIYPNIINFLIVTNDFLTKIKDYWQKSNSTIQELSTYSKIWNSLLHELIVPYKTDSSVGTITTLLNNVFNSKGTLNIYIGDFLTKSEREKNKTLFESSKMNDWFKQLTEIRNSNFHLGAGKFEKDDDYLMIYILETNKNKNNFNSTIRFIYEVKNLIVNSYVYIWQIFNYYCDGLLIPSKKVRDNLSIYLEDISKWLI